MIMASITNDRGSSEHAFPFALLAFHAFAWLLAAIFVFARPFGTGAFASMNAFPVLVMFGVVLTCLGASGARLQLPWLASRGETVTDDAAPAEPARRVLAEGGRWLVALAAAVVVVPVLTGLALVLLNLLAAAGEQRASVGAMPFERLLMPATDGLVTVCQWLLLPGIASSVACVWRSKRSVALTGESSASTSLPDEGRSRGSHGDRSRRRAARTALVCLYVFLTVALAFALARAEMMDRRGARSGFEALDAAHRAGR